MFVSAAVDLQFHSFTTKGSSEDIVYTPLGTEEDVTSVSWSKDNGFLTFVTKNGNPEILSIKDPNNIKNVHTISAIADTSTVAFQKTTKRCIGLATNSGQVALYDTKSKMISKLFPSAKFPLNLIDFNFDDKQMAVSCKNGSILLYDVKRGSICDTYIASETCSATAMLYHPVETHILCIGMEDGTVMQWDTNVGLARFCYPLHTSPVGGLALLQKSDLIVSVGYDHKFCIHNLNQQLVFRSNQQHPLTAVDVSPDGVMIAVGCQMGNIYIYDIRKLIQPVSTWRAHDSSINKILFERKVKYSISDAESDIHVTACNENYKMNSVYVNKFVHQDTDHCDIQTNVHMGRPLKTTADKEHRSISDKKNRNETISIKSMKHAVADSILNSTNEVRSHLTSQFANFNSFIKNEFQTIDAQIEQKWDLLTLASDATHFIHSTEILE